MLFQFRLVLLLHFDPLQFCQFIPVDIEGQGQFLRGLVLEDGQVDDMLVEGGILFLQSVLEGDVLVVEILVDFKSF